MCRIWASSRAQPWTEAIAECIPSRAVVEIRTDPDDAGDRMARENQEYLVDVRSSEELEQQRVDARRTISEIEKIFPKVRSLLEGSDFGRDAVRKAEGVIERARRAMEGDDLAALKTSNEALGRTLGMFKGVVQKIG